MSTDCTVQLAAQVRDALTSGGALSICGAGSKPWRSGRFDARLDIGEHCGVISYDPGELVVVVRAGTTLVELDGVLAEHGQMLAAEPPNFGGAATVGGAVALGWSGSRRPFAGPLRDAVLGIRMLNGLGEVLSFGGQVMKNVAGFDVPRLMTGSQGRLGVILDVSLRVVPMPPAEVTLRLECESPEAASGRVRAALQQGQPMTAASYCDGVQRVRLAGHSATLEQLRREWQAELEQNDYWEKLRRLQAPEHAATGRVDDWNGQLHWHFAEGRASVRQLVGQEPVQLDQGPGCASPEPMLAQLQGQLRAAFDPAAIFERPVPDDEGEGGRPQ
jgi:glycolate oxidase FAD binding subunit